MKRREMIFLVAGLLLGLLFGMVLIGSNDDLRESLFGTAQASKAGSTAYYLVDLPTAQEWLIEKYPDTSDKLKSAMDVIAKLPTSSDFRKDYVEAKEPVEQTVLPQMFGALIGADNIQEPKIPKDNKISVCLGLDDNPYNEQGAAIYLYISIPAEKAKSIGIPKDWQKLTESKENDLYWQLLACYPQIESKK
jgi:hypothetical protein